MVTGVNGDAVVAAGSYQTLPPCLQSGVDVLGAGAQARITEVAVDEAIDDQ